MLKPSMEPATTSLQETLEPSLGAWNLFPTNYIPAPKFRLASSDEVTLWSQPQLHCRKRSSRPWALGICSREITFLHRSSGWLLEAKRDAKAFLPKPDRGQNPGECRVGIEVGSARSRRELHCGTVICREQIPSAQGWLERVPRGSSGWLLAQKRSNEID